MCEEVVIMFGKLCIVIVCELFVVVFDDDYW